MGKDIQTVTEIEEILSSGVFGKLKGAHENEILEAKSELWSLDSDEDKFEFAKDVSAFANLSGGIIVIGARTKEGLTEHRNEITETPGLPKDKWPGEERYLHIIQMWVYPVPAGFRIKWYPDPNDAARGMVGIHIPNQDEGRRPFLVAKVFTPRPGRPPGWLFGFVERLSSVTNPITLEELQGYLREGRRLDVIHQKLDAIISRLETLEAHGGPEKEDEQQ